MKRILITLTALLLAFSGLAKEPSTVTVMSLNTRGESKDDGTNSWAYRYPALGMMFDDIKPDVTCLQEATALQMEYFCEIVSQYKCVGVGRDDGKKNGEYTTIMYNSKKFSVSKHGSFWLSDTPDVASAGWGADHACNAYWAILKDKKAGSSILVVNTHIDVLDEGFRQKAMDLIAEKIASLNKDNLPVVLCGGFNMKNEDACMGAVKGSMQNAREVAFTSDNTRTYHNYGKVSEVIDHIFIGGFSSCQEFKTITTRYYDRAFVSDHNPIMASLIY